MLPVLVNEALASGRLRRGEYTAGIEEQHERADHGREIPVVLRIAGRDSEQLGA